MELTVDRVTKQFQNKIAVDRVSARMTPGIYGLLGANGAGKTTLMRMMAGILKPDSGEIRLDGIAVSAREYRERLGFLPQNFGYYPNFTAREFLMYLAALKGLTRDTAARRSAELLELVNLADVSKKKIRTFSGGMKQRLGIAQALLNDPGVLILDEPTAGLDPKERVKFRNMLSSMKKGRIILLSTHIVSDVEYIADQILIMKDGRFLHHGTVKEICGTIADKVWEGRVDQAEYLRLAQRYTVLNIREERDGIFFRLVGDQQPFGTAVPAEASLEDLYLYYFSRKEEKML